MKQDDFFQVFQQGEKRLHSGDPEGAKIFFLNAAKILYQKVKEDLDPTERQKWLDRADKIYALAQKIPSSAPQKKEESRPVKKSSDSTPTHPPVDSQETDEKSSRWEMAQRPDVTFADIAGLAEVKRILNNRIIQPWSHPELAKMYGRTGGAGVLMYGPPGTGKTMMAKAIAGELNVPFFSVSSSNILSKWVGEAEANIRDLFNEARAKAPSVLFFDEMEALLASRGMNSTIMSRVVPEFLQQVDGVGSGSAQLLLIGATNRPWDLDSAATRPGRFGEKIYVPLPDQEAREFLLRKKLEKMPGGNALNFSDLSLRIEGCSGADINGLVGRIIDPAYERAIAGGEMSAITPEDVSSALKDFHPSVSSSELKRFERYQKQGE